MRFIFIIFSIVLIVASCTKREESKIIGNWYRNDSWIMTGINDTLPNEINNQGPSRPPIYYPFGWEFKKNDSVKYFLGLWEKKENKNVYLGDCRRYEIEDDSLLIFNHQESVHRAYRFEFKGNDTLNLYSKNTSLVFIRFNYVVKNHIKIDSIKIRHGDGWGRNVEYKIKSNGIISLRDKTIGYYKEDLNLDRQGNVGAHAFRKIEKMYNLADFTKLKDYSDCCDGDDYTITVYYKGIEKQVYDYMNSSPMQFVWANTRMIRLIESELR